MTLVPTGELVDAARAAGRGVAAFNVVGLEHLEAAAAGAARAGGAAIIAVSANAVRFREGRVEPLAAACVALAEAADAPLALHLDHAADLALCRRAAAAGFGSVMFDAGGLSAAENLEATRRVAAWGADHGVWVEAEIDHIGGKEGEHADEPSDPEAAARFAAASGVDGLAVAVGTRHKMTVRDAPLDLERIAALRAAVAVPLVLHGSSGVADETLAAGVASGLTKVNVGTRLNVAYTTAVRRALRELPDAVDPRPALAAARAAMAEEVERVVAALAAPGAAPPR